ncbi:MAG: DUF362 domain-containing protein [Cyclobacteriaceae bacterium]|jgi:uncharacterized protein (DUF362 family)
MNGFVTISTVYDQDKRSTEELGRLYDDSNFLKNELRKIIEGRLTKENVFGKKIFLKPNWVNHDRQQTDTICLRTHNNFLLAFVEVVCELTPCSIVIGDAPIQGCNWQKMMSDHLIQAVQQLAHKFQIPIAIKDLRRVVFRTGENVLESDRRSVDDFVIFDLGAKSYLEPITIEGVNNFRVTHYNPDRFLESHKKGMHKYCITKELFEADIVISLPKAKTHEKSGITGALKNIVGLNGDKDFLPHHRIGGTKVGGDSYPGRNPLRYLSELCYDMANRNKGKRIYYFWVRLATLIWRSTFPDSMTRFGAGWHGNDTTWRMVMDLNLIARYGNKDGSLSKAPVRELFSLCDGIIGGQGDGPLKPDPLNLGVIAFTNQSAYCDTCLAILMGMEIDRLPLLTAARAQEQDKNVFIILNQKQIQLDELNKYRTEAQMPSGWLNYKN